MEIAGKNPVVRQGFGRDGRIDCCLCAGQERVRCDPYFLLSAYVSTSVLGNTARSERV